MNLNKLSIPNIYLLIMINIIFYDIYYLDLKLNLKLKLK